MDLLLSDIDSISESSSSIDQDDVEFMYGGQARSILSSLEEAIGKIDDFLSFERGFMHGDIVCSMADPSGQIGRVINVDMIVNLENVYGDIIKNINSRDLQKLHSISVGDYVVYGPWLGKVDRVIDIITILFDDGTKSELTYASPEKLVPVSPDLLEDSQYPYYPGQRVRVVGLSSISKSPRWLCGKQKEKQDEATVYAVDAGIVYVDWLGCAVASCERLPTPRRMLEAKNLTLLQCFLHAKWQVGDWCTLHVADHMTVVGQTLLDSPSCGLIKGHEQTGKIFRRGVRASNFQEMFLIVKTKTKIDVLWQDGTQSLGLDSQSLFPVNTVDPHDFLPGQFVLEKGTCDDPHVLSNQRWGVVRCMDAKERTAKVKWNNTSTKQTLNLEARWMEETVSAYELVEHVDYAFSVGDAVSRLHKNQSIALSDGTSYEKEMIKKIYMGEGAEYNGEAHVRDQKDCLSTSYLSCIGTVTDFKDGVVEVKWATGLETKVAPYEIFRMDKYEGPTTTTVLHDERVEESNDVIAQNSSQSSGQMDLFNFSGDGKDFEKNLWDSSLFSVPRAAVGFITSVAANLFGSLGSKSQNGTSVLMSDDAERLGIPREEEESLELTSMRTREQMLVVDDLQNSAMTNLEQRVKGTEEVEDLQFPTCSKFAKQFRQFDMVSDCSDHHFVDGVGKGLTSTQVKRGWLKKVQQEWSILQKDLPETIYVRIYEERMDLLRAAVVGAPGTPYHDNLFFFDIFLPQEYPLEPPLVHYNSGGLRVNPNLYESGRVCLSLLNTWTGTGSEVWNPEHSTILQVLLSLQALVLNEKPYFNEAGFDKQIGRAEGEKNSLTYNENAFLVSCKSMLYLLHWPPKHFEALVDEHFNQCCKDILLACKKYMEGAPVGCAFGDDSKPEPGILKGSSTGFKIMLAKLLPKLVEAFSCKGIDCGQFVGPEKLLTLGLYHMV